MSRIIIKNGQVYDGIAPQLFKADILIENDKIADISPQITASEAEVLKADGRIVAPGFIDVHAHSEVRKLKYPENRTKILQGVTTEVDGNCGTSACFSGFDNGEFQWQDFAGYLEVLNRIRSATNSVFMAGHNSLRKNVMGLKNSLPTSEELLKMQKLLAAALEAGAAGFSSGLTYFPGKFSDSAELQAIASVMKGKEKVYASHIRNEAGDILAAVDEALAIARSGGGYFQFSHLKTMFKPNWHLLDKVLEKIAEAQKDGLRVTADRYPYIYSATGLHQILPPPFDKNNNISAYLRESFRHQNEVEAALKHSPRDLASTILAVYGKTLGEIAAEQNISVEKVAMQCLMENNTQAAAYLAMSPENLQKILALPYVMPGTDGISNQLDDATDFIHPRAAGTFPRFFRMVSQSCGIVETLRRMTVLPAQIFRIPYRGILKKGFFADVVIFDADNFDSRAGYDGKEQTPTGMDKVLVNGKVAFDSAAPAVIGRYGRYLPIN